MFEPRNKIWVGKRRQGKTLAMVSALKKPMYFGTPVYSNLRIRFTFKDRCVYSFFCPDGDSFLRAMKTKKNCIFACDEIGLVFPAQYWTRMDMSLLSLFKQSGHIGVAFWGTTHNLSDIVGKLRYLVDDLYLCYKRSFFGMVFLPYIKSWKRLLICDWFTHWKETPYGRKIPYNNTWAKIPSYVFKINQMKPSYKGDGGARQFINNLIRSWKIYPSTYYPAMLAYDTQQWIKGDVMVKGNETVSGRKYTRYHTTRQTIKSRIETPVVKQESPVPVLNKDNDQVLQGIRKGHLDRLFESYASNVKN